jgi:hypothetical protein
VAERATIGGNEAIAESTGELRRGLYGLSALLEALVRAKVKSPKNYLPWAQL